METNVNNKCRAFTSLEQSKKLAKILPLQSADMCYYNDGTAIKIDANPYPVRNSMWKDYYIGVIPCWSLASLLGVLPSASLDSSDEHHYRIHCKERFTEWHDNAVDACVKMIVELKERGLL